MCDLWTLLYCVNVHDSVSRYKAPDFTILKMTTIYWRHGRVMMCSIKNYCLHNILCHGAILSMLELILSIHSRTSTRKDPFLLCTEKDYRTDGAAVTTTALFKLRESMVPSSPVACVGRCRGARHIERKDVFSRFIIMKLIKRTRRSKVAKKFSHAIERKQQQVERWHKMPNDVIIWPIHALD